MQSKSKGTTCLLTSLGLFAVIACARDAESEPVPDHPGAPIDKSSEFYRQWPQGRPALYRLSNHVIFAIPPQYQRFWLQKNLVVRAPADPKTIPQAESLAFEFFMPDFSGYTPKNYMNAFDDDRVDVIDIEPADSAQMQPGAPGYYPPNMIKRALGSYLSSDNSQDLYGLRCYAQRGSGTKPRELTCYGRRDDQTREDIMLDAYVPPFDAGTVYPLIQAVYYSNRYGGLKVVWRTNVRNFSRWREIDAQIWRFIAEWSAAGNSFTSAATDTTLSQE
jgi:hypothetical protein